MVRGFTTPLIDDFNLTPAVLIISTFRPADCLQLATTNGTFHICLNRSGIAVVDLFVVKALFDLPSSNLGRVKYCTVLWLMAFLRPSRQIKRHYRYAGLNRLFLRTSQLIAHRL